MAKTKLEELLALSALTQGQGGLGSLGEQILSPTGAKGGGLTLNDILSAAAEEPRSPQEMNTQIDIPGLLGNFTNREYGPRSSGVPYIFTGGSPFPRTEGQVRAGQLAARMALLNNVLDSMGSITKSTVPKIVEMIKKKKGQSNG